MTLLHAGEGDDCHYNAMEVTGGQQLLGNSSIPLDSTEMLETNTWREDISYINFGKVIFDKIRVMSGPKGP